MKPLILFIVFFAAPFPCGAQQTDKAQDEFVRLLADIPSTNALLENTKFLSHVNADTNKELVEHARGQIEKARKAIPEIRKLILKGKSVFDYPGLLACGRITYAKFEGYELYFGFHFGGQGTDPYDFRVIFNSQGVITDVQDVLWKK